MCCCCFLYSTCVFCSLLPQRLTRQSSQHWRYSPPEESKRRAQCRTPSLKRSRLTLHREFYIVIMGIYVELKDVVSKIDLFLLLDWYIHKSHTVLVVLIVLFPWTMCRATRWCRVNYSVMLTMIVFGCCSCFADCCLVGEVRRGLGTNSMFVI